MNTGCCASDFSGATRRVVITDAVVATTGMMMLDVDTATLDDDDGCCGCSTDTCDAGTVASTCGVADTDADDVDDAMDVIITPCI